ncbi:MAG: isocitrate lyase/phosphoenolpyruvate mutase family protein [Steroidobacteraceae bacterium]
MGLARLTLPERRRPLLKQLLRESRLLRAIECHDPLSAMVGSHASSSDGVAGKAQFDVLWASGFAHATTLGLPDSEMAILERRIDTVAGIAAVTAKPILVDADTGGDAVALLCLCQRLEQMGACGVVVEDKIGAKRTSLASDVRHVLEEPAAFVHKIAHAKAGLLTDDFLIFARIESLIAGAGMEDALHRAELYLKSSADGIVIHSKDRSGAEIAAFMQAYGRLQLSLGVAKPLVCIPTAYPHMLGTELQRLGASILIHGNHMVRAAYRGMQLAARSILDHDRSLEADAVCASVEELLQATSIDPPSPRSNVSKDSARRTATERQ